MQILQQAAGQYPGQNEINELLTVAESRAREQIMVEIEQQAQAQVNEERFDEALRTLEDGLNGFPEARSLQEAWNSVSAARQRAEQLAEGRRLRQTGEFAAALAIISAALQSTPNDGEFQTLKLLIESDHAKLQRQQAVAKSVEEAQQYLRESQNVRAIETLQGCAARFPSDRTISQLLRFAKEQRRTELEWNSIRAQVEELESEGQEEEAVALLEKGLLKGPGFEELLASCCGKLNTKRREELLSQAALLQSRVHYEEAQGLVRLAISKYGSTPAAADLEQTLRAQIGAERKQQAHDADRDKLLAIEQKLSTGGKSKLKKFAVRVQEIAAHIGQEIQTQLSVLPAQHDIPLRWIAGVAGIVVVLLGIIAAPRLFHVNLVPVEIRSDPPGASVRIGDRSCTTPNCRFDLKPGQYGIEARLDGYQPTEKSFSLDSAKDIHILTLKLQPLPPPSQRSNAKPAAMGTLLVKSLPESSVFVDNTERGVTDEQGVFSLQLKAKVYQVRVEKKGYQTPQDQHVDVARGASPPLTFKLDPVGAETKVEPGVTSESGSPRPLETSTLSRGPSPESSQNTSILPNYDLHTEVKVKGIIEEVNSLPLGSKKDFTELIIKDGTDKSHIYLCPRTFLEELGVSLNKGDQIVVSGSKVKQESFEMILARELVKGTDTLVFRDAQGNPVCGVRDLSYGRKCCRMC